MLNIRKSMYKYRAKHFFLQKKRAGLHMSLFLCIFAADLN